MLILLCWFIFFELRENFLYRTGVNTFDVFRFCLYTYWTQCCESTFFRERHSPTRCTGGCPTKRVAIFGTNQNKPLFCITIRFEFWNNSVHIWFFNRFYSLCKYRLSEIICIFAHDNLICKQAQIIKKKWGSQTASSIFFRKNSVLGH